MIPRLFAIALVPCAAFSGQFSVSAMAGYGIPLPGHYQGENSTEDLDQDEDEYEAVYGSYADGLRFGGGVGYSVSEYASLEFGLRYLKSSEIETTDGSISGGIKTTRKTTSSIEGIWLSPGVVFTLPGEKIAPYMRWYANIGFPTETEEYTSSSTSPTGNVFEREVEYTGGTAWGFGGGIGAEYHVSPMVSVLFEVVSEYGTWAPEKGKLTKMTRNGVDQLGEMESSQKQIKYVDSYTVTPNDDPDAISKQLRKDETHAAVAMNVGAKFRF